MLGLAFAPDLSALSLGLSTPPLGLAFWGCMWPLSALPGMLGYWKHVHRGHGSWEGEVHGPIWKQLGPESLGP